jgi:pimeloyl-ACP methyl ester carboxylesterase
LNHSLRVHNRKVDVEWHCLGHSNNPTLVFLHEGLGCVSLWKDIPCILSQMTHCNAFVFSRPGYGLSDPGISPWKINFMHTQATNFLPAVLKAAGIRDHIIIGHSDGGSIGIVYAGSPRASRLKGLVTEAAHVFCEPVTVDAVKQAKNQFLHHDLKKALEKYHGANTESAFWGWNNVWLHPRFIHWNIEKYLKRIKVPMLALQGRQDQYGTPAQLTAIASGVKDCETHLIDPCCHTPHKDQKETVLALIAGFIHKRLVPPAQK